MDRKRILLSVVLLFLLAGYASASCVGDGDCAPNEFCNSTLECQGDLADDEPCDRDAMCINDNCVAGNCTPAGYECWGDYNGCDGNAYDCISGNCTFNASKFNIGEFNGVKTTNLSTISDPDNASFMLHDNQVEVYFWDVNISDYIDFGTACDFVDWWAYCDPSQGANLASMTATVNFTGNDEWSIKLISGLVVLKDGIACTDCTGFAKSDNNAWFNITGFSNYSVSNTSSYDAVVSDLQCPTWVYIGTEEEPQYMSIAFDLKNTLGNALLGISCDIFVFDENDVLIEDRMARLRDDENLDNVTRWIPMTNTIGRYLYRWPITDYPYFVGQNYTVYAQCAALKTNCTFEVRGYQPSNLDDEIEYYQSAMQDMIIGGILLIGFVYFIMLLYRKHRSEGVFG